MAAPKIGGPMGPHSSLSAKAGTGYSLNLIPSLKPARPWEVRHIDAVR